MVQNTTKQSNREGTMKKALIVMVAVVAMMFALAAPAFAEGYNNSGYNFNDGSNSATYGANAGFYQTTTTAQPGSTSMIQSFQGPHGGYATTTNKCQDCHSTHYATGSYMLLRADNRTDACNFCHVGGGGSKTNIQMDNQYSATSVITSDSMGFGTGHTLGYKGKAPAGIDPAFSDTAGFACFDCHSPHGNSARILATFGAPGDIAGVGTVQGPIYQASLLDTMLRFRYGVDFTPTVVGNYAGQNIDAVPAAAAPVWSEMNQFIGAVQAYSMARPGYGTPAGKTAMDAFDEGMGGSVDPLVGAVMTHGMGFFGSYNVRWGFDADKGNIVTKFWNIGMINSALAGFGIADAGQPDVAPRVETWKKPLFPKGRFMLLKDPNVSLTTGANPVEIPDTLATDPNDKSSIAGSGTAFGYHKIPIDWAKPNGPAATWGPLSMSKSADVFPLQFPWAPNGVGMENEFCADCHAGAAGESQQAAKVWRPDPLQNGKNDAGAYLTAYSHDSNPKGCARQQILNPQNKDNMGPHCRNCHTGAASCNQCHGPLDGSDSAMSRKNWESYWTDGDWTAWDGQQNSLVSSQTIGLEGKSGYIPPAYVGASAVANINGQCVDGGFSYPHRTLGANMLKDSLYGVDFDGKKLAFGATRGAGKTDSTIAAYFGQPATQAGSDIYFGRTDPTYPKSAKIASLINTKVENLDSVCIDCHGDATAYKGQLAYIDKYYFPSNFDVSGNTAPNHVTGWELLLKGLP